MKATKIILALAVLTSTIITLASLSTTALASEEKQMCYTHIKRWHPCPVQPK